MRLQKLRINSRFKNLEDFEIDFTAKDGITVLIGNNGSGKSNILEAISSVFAGLYNNKYNPIFEYELSYIKDNKNIEVNYINKIYAVKVNGIIDNMKTEFLPSQIVSSYSGEENRLWTEYYEPFYQDYIRALRGATLPNSNLVYINKYYWNLALLTFHFYDFSVFTDIRDFCQKTLGIETLNFIKLSFDIPKLKEWSRNPNPVTNFVNTLNPNQENTVQLSLDEFKTRLSFIANEIDLFRYLSASFMPREDKLITKVELNINSNLSADCLSEGEKKLLLIKLILEVVGDENSLILLDEPDSHIHISRKQDFKDLLKQYANRENILTTHSPTLTHSFESKHITMLTKKPNNDAQIEVKEKQEIVHELTKGIWSYQQQNIFLNSNNDILLVEGKSDETFLKKALEVLKKTQPRFRELQFEYLPCGGADGVKLMTKKFVPKTGQHIIALFDSDQAGWSSINKIFERNDQNKFSSNNFNRYQKQGDIWVAVFPTRRFYRGGSNFNIEDYFSKSLLNWYILNSFKGLDSIVTKDKIKRTLEADCNGFSDDKFGHFKSVFDLILEIKSK